LDKKLMMRISILFLIFIAFWGTVYAAYVIYSNTAITQVGAYALILSTPAKAPLYSNIILTATLTKDGTGLSDETVRFYQDLGSFQLIGSDITDASGIATMEWNVTTNGALSFQAQYSIP